MSQPWVIVMGAPHYAQYNGSPDAYGNYWGWQSSVATRPSRTSSVGFRCARNL